VPVYSEIVGPGKHELGIDEDIITDLASGLSNTVYFLGQMIGYTTCSYVYTNVGFPATIDMLGTLLLTVAIAYFFMCDKSMLGSKDFDSDKELSQKVIFNEDIKAPLIDSIL